VSGRVESALFSGVFSVVPTRRRRFFWAAWWTSPPDTDTPVFRPPDASNGGARTLEEARGAAEKAAGQPLVQIDGRLAGACLRVLRGEPPFPKPRGPAEPPRQRIHVSPPIGSPSWARALLGVTKDARPEAIKRAFRALALTTHPDRGGDAATFIDAKRALDVALHVALHVAPHAKPRRG